MKKNLFTNNYLQNFYDKKNHLSGVAVDLSL